MTDTATTETAPAADPPAPAVAASPAPPPAPAAPPAAETAAPDESKKFGEHYGYIQELRQEAAANRAEAAEFKAAFEGYDPEDRAVILDLARTLHTNPQTAAQWLVETGQALLEPGETNPAGEPPDDPNRPLTPADLDKWYADKRQQEEAAQREQAAIGEVYQQIDAAGYDHKSPDGTWILQKSTELGYDVGKAIEALKARDKKLVDDAIAGLKGDADGAARTPPASGAARETEGDSGSLGSRKFREIVRARIEAQRQ